MKVYVIVGGWNYEGLDTPIAVLRKKRDVLKALESIFSRYDNRKVFQYTIGKILKPCSEIKELKVNYSADLGFYFPKKKPKKVHSVVVPWPVGSKHKDGFTLSELLLGLGSTNH